MKTIKDALCFVSVFCATVWRQIEPPDCGIPDPFRIKGRITIPQAYHVAKTCVGIRRGTASSGNDFADLEFQALWLFSSIVLAALKQAAAPDPEARALARLDRWMETCPDAGTDFMIQTVPRADRPEYTPDTLQPYRYHLTIWGTNDDAESDAWGATLAECVDKILGEEKKGPTP